VSRSVADRSPAGRLRRIRRPAYRAVAVLAVVVMSAVAAVPARAASTFVVLQMNLCNSGMAVGSCYTFGRSVDEAVEKIHRYPPEMVTLQEVCRDDLYAGRRWGKLARAMADLYGGRHVSVDFVPAFNRDTDDWYRCVNGSLYGIALIHHGTGRDVHRGWYRSQDSSEEVRAWTCTTVVEDRLTGCTTHLSTDPDVAIRQCRELMSTLTSSWVQPEIIVGGDFNLTDEPGKRQDVRTCVPPDYARRSDSALQQVFYTRDTQWVRGAYEPMRFTDHPLLYERFRV
jgi:hypothetical protein